MQLNSLEYNSIHGPLIIFNIQNSSCLLWETSTVEAGSDLILENCLQSQQWSLIQLFPAAVACSLGLNWLCLFVLLDVRHQKDVYSSALESLLFNLISAPLKCVECWEVQGDPGSLLVLLYSGLLDFYVLYLTSWNFLLFFITSFIFWLPLCTTFFVYFVLLQDHF